MNEQNSPYTPSRPADFDYDAALAEIQERIRRKSKVKKLLAYFAEEATRLTGVMEDRKREYDTEQEEADALREDSMLLFFYTILGVKDEKISKEETEALMAGAEYETAKAELDHVLNRQVELRAELRSLGNCERDYEEMLAEKKVWLLAREATVNAEVEALEAEKAAIIRDSKELKEAAESGRYAVKVAYSTIDAMEWYAIWKMRILDRDDHRRYNVAKELHDARARVINSLHTLSRYLQDFSAELTDLHNLSEPPIPKARIRETVSWLQHRIENVTTKRHGDSRGVASILGELEPLVKALESKYAETEAACREIDEKIRAMVIAK